MSSDKVRDLGCEPDEYVDYFACNPCECGGHAECPVCGIEAEVRTKEATRCSCTYGAYVKYAGGTGFDIVKHDPECPEHGDEDREPHDNSFYNR